jgi:hypothetical protein
MGLLSIGSLGIFIWGFGFFILHDIGRLGLNSLRALGSLASSDLISRFKFEYWAHSCQELIVVLCYVYWPHGLHGGLRNSESPL